jgi:hypothetical protein
LQNSDDNEVDWIDGVILFAMLLSWLKRLTGIKVIGFVVVLFISLLVNSVFCLFEVNYLGLAWSSWWGSLRIKRIL